MFEDRILQGVIATKLLTFYAEGASLLKKESYRVGDLDAMAMAKAAEIMEKMNESREVSHADNPF